MSEVLSSRGRRSTTARPTDDELLDGALAVFAEVGFHAATMQQIADQAGCTKPTLYAHFGTKDALYAVVVEREVTALRQWMYNAYDSILDKPLDEQVRVSTQALFIYAGAHQDGFRLLFGDQATGAALEGRERLVRAVHKRLNLRIRQYLADHGRPATRSTHVLTTMCVASALKAAEIALLTAHLDPKITGELATSFISSGLRGTDYELMAALDEEPSG
jgi:AcrR family transcriptional regulator